ncbi:MAG: hypothetical protein ACOCX2_06685 [Armatimonadota bacterium]
MRTAFVGALALMLTGTCSAQQADMRVTIDRAIPVAGEAVTVGCRYFPDSPSNVGFSFEVTREATGETSVLGGHAGTEQPDGSRWGSVDWTPRHDGLHTLRAMMAVGEDRVAERQVWVVRHPLHFIWYGSGPELRYATAITPEGPAELLRLWRDRGVKLLDWKGAKGENAEALAGGWMKFGELDGIAIDEIGGYDRDPASQERKHIALDALQIFAEGRPDAMLAVWNAGSLTAPAANAYRKYADVVMLEAYRQYIRGAFGTHSFYDYLDQRIRMARQIDVLRKAVIGLGITNARGGVTRAEIIRSIEHIRLTGPEMPGIAWFRHAGPERVEPEILRTADEAALRYFIRPCLMVRAWDLQFVPGNPGRLCVNVHNIGGMDATPVSVAFYAGDPERGGELIGRRDNVGVHAARGWSEQMESLPPEEARSRAYGVREVSAPWSPEADATDVWVRIHAPGATVLADVAHRRMATPRGW